MNDPDSFLKLGVLDLIRSSQYSSFWSCFVVMRVLRCYHIVIPGDSFTHIKISVSTVDVSVFQTMIS